jgi:hypothetical protein
MIIKDRSAIEKLFDACVIDNTTIETAIYEKQENDTWIYILPDNSLEKDNTYKAIISISNIGKEIDFTDVQLDVRTTSDTMPIEIIDSESDGQYQKKHFNIGTLNSQDDRINETVKQIVSLEFKTKCSILKEERDKLFRYALYATIIPRGQSRLWSPQQDFPRPIIVVSPDPIDFGKVNVNEPSLKKVTISNIGQADLNIYEITPPLNKSFKLDGPDVFESKIGPRQGRSLWCITFNPTKEGTLQKDIIKISSSDPLCPIKEVPLTGEGAHWFRYDPKSIDFGEIIGLMPVDRYVTFKNTHPAAPCTVIIRTPKPEKIKGIEFEVSPGSNTPIPLAAKESLQAKLTVELASPEGRGKKFEDKLDIVVESGRETRTFTILFKVKVPL